MAVAQRQAGDEPEGARAGYAPATMADLLASLPPAARVLDLGAGSGSFPYSDYPHLRIAALDPARPPASGGFPAHVEFRQGTAERLPYPDGTFDLVIANFVLEHVVGFRAAIDEVARVLAQDGYFYMSVPDARSFEDWIYRGLYAGGDHLQRHTVESVLATVYGQTALKLIAYTEWPSGFTFLGEYEGLRALTGALVTACYETLGVNLRARGNYLFVFQLQRGLGRRVFTAVCGYCGSGTTEPVNVATSWTCPACGRINGGAATSAISADRLDAETRALWAQYPTLRPGTPRNLAFRLQQALRVRRAARDRQAALAKHQDVHATLPHRLRLAWRLLRDGRL